MFSFRVCFSVLRTRITYFFLQSVLAGLSPRQLSEAVSVTEFPIESLFLSSAAAGRERESRDVGGAKSMMISVRNRKVLLARYRYNVSGSTISNYDADSLQSSVHWLQ